MVVILVKCVLVAAWCTLLLPLSSLAAQSEEAVPIAGHRAVYNLELASVSSGSSIVSVSGRMVYEISGSRCNGYTQIWRYVSRTSSRDGTTTLSDQQSRSWESGDGQRLKFESFQYFDGKLVSSVMGRARRSSDNKSITVNIRIPKRREFMLPGSVLFPIQHQVRMIEAGRRGQRLFVAQFFDGSESGDKFYNLSVLLGRGAGPDANRSLPKVPNVSKLDGVPAWPVSLSYFDVNKEHTDQVPVYEIAFLFFENGVSRRLRLDHGTHAIKGALAKIKFLDPDPCRPSNRR